jgi:ABC-type sugar transport system ATPase subunit
MLTLFGARRRRTGAVRLDGRPVALGSPAEAIAAGLVYSPEDRKEQGLFLHMSVASNIAAASLARCSTMGFVSRSRQAALAGRMAGELCIKAAGPEQEAGALSGGNQQKVLLAKCLAAEPRVLIVDEPTRGIDVGAKIEIYGLLRDYARRGGAVAVISSELPELIGLCDRVVVFKGGRVTGTLDGEITENQVLHLMMSEAVC